MTRRRICAAIVLCAVPVVVGACGADGPHTVEITVNRGIDAVTLGMTRDQVHAATGIGTGTSPVVTTADHIVVEFDASGRIASLHIREGAACLTHPRVCLGQRGGAREAAEAFGKAARAENEDFQTMVVIRGSYRGRKATTMLWYSAPGSAGDEGTGLPADKVPASAPIRAIDLYLSE